VSARVQDGWERWDEPTLDGAKKHVISAAKFLNGTTIGEDGISIRV